MNAMEFQQITQVVIIQLQIDCLVLLHAYALWLAILMINGSNKVCSAWDF